MDKNNLEFESKYTNMADLNLKIDLIVKKLLHKKICYVKIIMWYLIYRRCYG